MVDERESIWRASVSPSRWGPLNGDKEYDVVVVGAGIAGLTAAHSLARAGRRVAVVEMHDLGAGESGNTTAHLTEMLDTPYRQLKKDFGLTGARLAAQSSRVAIEHIASTCERYDIRCEFTRLPG